MTNALLELAPLDKKAEIVLQDGRFIEIYKVKVKHYLAATDPNNIISIIKLILVCTKIDDHAPTFEEILNLDLSDFNKIVVELQK
jgi:hypothetical protein